MTYEKEHSPPKFRILKAQLEKTQKSKYKS